MNQANTYPEIIVDDTGAKDPVTWLETLLMDDEGLPAGRQWERYVFDCTGKPMELRVYARPDVTDPPRTACYEGWIDQGQICLSTTKQDCIDFLVDWARVNKRSF